MTRNLAARLANILIGHAVSDRYPTRSVEYMLAWMMVGLSTMLCMQSEWALLGVVLGAVRIGALVLNGSWKRSPVLRLIGASIGFQFWSVIAALHILNDASVFPIIGTFPVILFFEAYSCFRCGQDARSASER
jgi:hypothetical protein